MWPLTRTVKLFAFTVLIFSITTTNATESHKSFLWKIQNKNNSLYLLGSVHMANKSLYPLHEIIENSFEKASRLVVELNNKKVNINKMQQIIANKGMYSDGGSIKAHIAADLFNLLEKFLAENKISHNNLYQYKPGILSMILSSAQANNLGYSAEFGIDRYFIDKAERQNKAIVELESMEEQLSLFIDMPNQSLMLRYTLEELSEMNNEFDGLLNIWQSGDYKRLNELTLVEPLQKHPELEPIFEKLFFARNRRMSNDIESFLNSNQVYFVVVGAGHLVGNIGILELLKKRGYFVSQL